MRLICVIITDAACVEGDGGLQNYKRQNAIKRIGNHKTNHASLIFDAGRE